MTDATRGEPEQIISQANFEPTEYADETWEIVGEHNPQEHFVPMEVAALPRSNVITDPMFADYGGIGEEAPARWHLPDGVAVAAPKRRDRREQSVEQEQGISQAEVAALVEQAREQGKAEALVEFSLAQNEKLSALETRFGAVLQDIATQFNEQIVQLEQKALQLSIALAEKVIAQAVEINPEYLLGVLHEALSHVGSASAKRIRVSPADLEFVDVLGIRKRMKEFDGTWDFEADETIKMGCVIETSAGEIDFDLGAAWERIKERVATCKRGAGDA